MKDLRYLTDSYDEKIKKVLECNAPFNFIFITDEHNRLGEYARAYNNNTYEFATDAIESMRYIIDRCKINCIVNGGDIGNDYSTDPAGLHASFRETMDSLYALGIPVHSCIGNHDCGTGNANDLGLDNRPFAVLPDELHSLFMKYNPTKENYYYADIPGTDCRLVMLNVIDLPPATDENGQYIYSWGDLMISNCQAKWFENEALATDRRVIVVSHAPLSTEGIYGTDNMPVPFKPYDDVMNAPRILYDIRKSKNVIMMLAGHVHFDNLRYYSNIASVTTLCSFVQQWAPTSPKRVVGTPTETAFDVFSVLEDKIVITRFGAGEDRCAVIYRR